jgi:hypothetical protein
MKPRHRQLTHFRLVVFAAAMFLAAPVAHAFTYDTKSNTNSDGTPKFTDPDEKVEQFGTGNVRTQPDSGTFRLNIGPANGPDQNGRFNPSWGPQTFPDRR